MKTKLKRISLVTLLFSLISCGTPQPLPGIKLSPEAPKTFKSFSSSSLKLDVSPGFDRSKYVYFDKFMKIPFKADIRGVAVNAGTEKVPIEVARDISDGTRVEPLMFDEEIEMALNRILSGQTNRVELDRPGYENDITIRKSGNRIEIDKSGYENDITIRQSNSRIEFDKSGYQNDLTVRGSSSRVEIDHTGYQDDVTVRFSSNRIELDRTGYENDITIRKSGNRIEIDKSGYEDDITIRYYSNRIEIDRQGYDNDQTIRL